MYERFTDRARKVVQLANQEAQRFNHESIGTEHILLSLVREGSGVAANVLNNLAVDPLQIRLEIEKIISSGPDMVTGGKLPLTPRAKRAIEYAMEEARNLNHNYVGSEHLLLGLLRETEGVAAQVLMNLGLRLKAVRSEILTILNQTSDAVSGSGTTPSSLSAEESRNIRWTDRTRNVMRLAAEEAYELGHTYLGPEHILLGLIREGSGLGNEILKSSGLNESKVRDEIKAILRVLRDIPDFAPFELTSLTTLAIDSAVMAARAFRTIRVDVDHLLLGLLQSNDGIVAQVFWNLDVKRSGLSEKIRFRLASVRD